MTSLPAFAANTGDNSRRVATVVRTDRRTGRLIRTVVVAPAITTPKPAAPAAEPQRTAPLPAPDPAIDRIVEQAARAYDVDPLLVHSVIKAESNYDPFAVSPKGARGLMQLIPSTARRFGVSNSFDPRQNIDAGVRYLRYLQDLFGDDRLALAAYNAGEGAVLKYGWIPPYAETQNYVDRVGRNWGAARRSADAAPGTGLQLVKEPEFRPLEAYQDENGRLCLRTK